MIGSLLIILCAIFTTVWLFKSINIIIKARVKPGASRTSQLLKLGVLFVIIIAVTLWSIFHFGWSTTP